MNIPSDIEVNIRQKLASLEKPGRIALSTRYPFLAGTILIFKQSVHSLRNIFNPQLARTNQADYFKHIISRHQSVLYRKLGDSDPHLQKQKVSNLRMAANKLDGLVISSGKAFSFWHAVGKPAYRKGYVDGMLLANGRVVEGVGGGLCQLSNLIFWLFLHTPLSITERHRHAFDVFPDSGRVLPFGSGATIMYNTIDLRATNNTNVDLQLKIWLTDKHLKGQILSFSQIPNKYHIYEKHHCFIKHKETYYRFNEIWREELIQGQIKHVEKITSNFAPVLYDVDETYLIQNGYKICYMD